MTLELLERTFEFVVIDSPNLAHVAPDTKAFAEHFNAASDGVAAFRNLGKDAMLVVPLPIANDQGIYFLFELSCTGY